MASIRHNIAYWIRSLRAGSKMTQAQLAAQLDMNRTALSFIEREKQGATPEMVYAMARLFRVPVGQFFEDPPGGGTP